LLLRAAAAEEFQRRTALGCQKGGQADTSRNQSHESKTINSYAMFRYSQKKEDDIVE
jgi:hypothetical protein